ncbi:DUF1330 domain-containing protein [Devosia ginsengisoli]|uniref:DUF1330 domain-containing protein n=1 Tax=Devosia ginsengisoli TaxID=400770 RepID=UPI0026EA558C|nr:DUF1330 domain-containing protein [Devosia ginsengisoli]MCR6673709.1 DUF1330 domain-containing protein [Devosia ginsengisoli]
MAKGYWIAQVDVEDTERYGEYSALIDATLAPFGGRFLVRGGRREDVEGAMRKRAILIEFDSYEQALACYRSAAYQAIIPLRTGAAIADIAVVEGGGAS